MPKTRLTPELLDRLAARFKALAEPNRLAILSALLEREQSVSELMETTGLGQANVSKHLRVLHQEGYVERRREGLNVIYALADDDVFAICDMMCGRMEREARGLGNLLAGTTGVARRRRG